MHSLPTRGPPPAGICPFSRPHANIHNICLRADDPANERLFFRIPSLAHTTGPPWAVNWPTLPGKKDHEWKRKSYTGGIHPER
eukprot:1160665-Pelagomonas_calceolata.AAC.3